MGRSTRVCGILVASIFLGASMQPVLAGIYGSFCDPETLADPCPNACSNYCQIFGAPAGTLGVCMVPPPPGPGTLRKLCADAFFTSCVGRGCPTTGWYCLGIIPTPGTQEGKCVCADAPAGSCQ